MKVITDQNTGDEFVISDELASELEFMMSEEGQKAITEEIDREIVESLRSFLLENRDEDTIR